jgi:alpha-glucosidase
VLLLTQRGTPFVYQGDELGLEDAAIPPDRKLDPGGRDGCRAPIPWEAGPLHGWPARDPWLPWPPDPDARSVEAERARPGSMLHLYRDLLAARRASPALRRGALRLLDAPGELLAYERSAGEDRRLVLVNFGEEPAAIELPGRWQTEIATGEAGEPGSVPPLGAALLRPA